MTLAAAVAKRAAEMYEAQREHGEVPWQELTAPVMAGWLNKAAEELRTRHVTVPYTPVIERSPQLPGVFVLDALEDGAQRRPEGRFAPRARFRDQEHPERTMSMPTAEWVESGRPTVIEVHL